MWLQGVYFFNAVSTALGNAFRKKGAKPVNYMEQPIRILPLSEEEKEAKAEQELSLIHILLLYNTHPQQSREHHDTYLANNNSQVSPPSIGIFG